MAQGGEEGASHSRSGADGGEVRRASTEHPTALVAAVLEATRNDAASCSTTHSPKRG